MKVLVSGSTGLIGSALVPSLTTAGHSVMRLVRTPAPGAVHWDPAAGRIDAAGLGGFDAVVHLAGESIAGGRWTLTRKARIRDSRVRGTRLLAEALAGLKAPPKTLICASAMGYYGDRGDEVLTEDSPPGKGFLADVCREWEAASAPAAQKGIRVVHTRFGLVLSPQGGALGKMLLPFKLGLGGRVGSGKQYWSWVAIDDLVGALQHALARADLKGPVNVVAPNPVRNEEFTKVLARVLSRPAFAPAPAFALRIAMGEMADELLLASARIKPERLLATGYTFRHPELEGALRHVLKKEAGQKGTRPAAPS